jgi:Flp pilus assembly protein TadB
MKGRKEAEKKIEEINTILKRSPRSNERIRIAVKTSDAEMSTAREEEKRRMEEKKKQEVLTRIWADREKVSKKGPEEKKFSSEESEERERKKFLERINSGEITNKVSSLPYQQIPVEEDFTPQPIPKKQSTFKKFLTRFFIFLIAFFLIAGLIVWYFFLRKR